MGEKVECGGVGGVRKEKEIIEKKSSERGGEMETKTRWFCFLLMEILIPLTVCVCVCVSSMCVTVTSRPQLRLFGFAGRSGQLVWLPALVERPVETAAEELSVYLQLQR